MVPEEEWQVSVSDVQNDCPSDAEIQRIFADAFNPSKQNPKNNHYMEIVDKEEKEDIAQDLSLDTLNTEMIENYNRNLLLSNDEENQCYQNKPYERLSFYPQRYKPKKAKQPIKGGDLSSCLNTKTKMIKKELTKFQSKRQSKKEETDFLQKMKIKKLPKFRRKKKRITEKILQRLHIRFETYHACECYPNYNGPKLSLREIGDQIDVGSSTTTRLYKEWLDDPGFMRRLKRMRVRSQGSEKKMTMERLEHIARLIKENPFLTQNEITVELNKIEDLKVTRNGVRLDINRSAVKRLLKIGKFKKKKVLCVPKERNTAKSLEKRFQYCNIYKRLVKQNARIYFLDESGFNLFMTRDKAWTRPNEQVTVNCPISKGKRFSLIAIIGVDGLAHWRIIEGTYRKYEYLDFIKELFQKLNQTDCQDEDTSEKYLILDNCAIHDKEQTMNLSKECSINVMFLPPYSPQLNPIENWFHQVKTQVRKTNYSGEKQLLQIMQRTLRNYEKYDFSNYYQGIQKHVEKGIRREKF